MPTKYSQRFPKSTRPAPPPPPSERNVYGEDTLARALLREFWDFKLFVWGSIVVGGAWALAETFAR